MRAQPPRGSRATYAGVGRGVQGSQSALSEGDSGQNKRQGSTLGGADTASLAPSESAFRFASDIGICEHCRISLSVCPIHRPRLPYREKMWPHQWLAGCSCGVGIRCNSEGEGLRFLRKQGCLRPSEERKPRKEAMR